MDDDNKFWLLLSGILVTGFVTLVLGCTWLCTRQQQKMAAMGYEEVVVMGQGGTCWQKVK